MVTARLNAVLFSVISTCLARVSVKARRDCSLGSATIGANCSSGRTPTGHDGAEARNDIKGNYIMSVLVDT